jgi:8-oxo-dGTP pyrophosphatase MutT (NUDIX family)
MLRRSAGSPFMPGVFVFPGGSVDPADYNDGPVAGWNDRRISTEFRARVPAELASEQPPVGPRDAYALVRAAARELTEEASITIDPRNLVLFSHWITPATERLRYNTHFFITVAPAGQSGAADAVETHDERWIAPKTALELHAHGHLHLVYPTVKHLERLVEFDNVDDLLRFARSKPIATIMPSGSAGEGFAMPTNLEGRW